MKPEFISMEQFVYHITLKDTWKDAQKTGFFTESSLKDQGFIHFSTKAQVVQTANKFYHGIQGLILLEVDCQKLPEKMVYEEAEPGAWFPHFYAPLPVDSVCRVMDFTPDSNGSFTWPETETN